MSNCFYLTSTDKKSACHPERRKPHAVCEVEVSPSEERGETEERMRRRDLRTSLGGLPRKMLHPVKKTTKSCNEIPLKHEVFFASFLALRSKKVRLALAAFSEMTG